MESKVGEGVLVKWGEGQIDNNHQSSSVLLDGPSSVEGMQLTPLSLCGSFDISKRFIHCAVFALDSPNTPGPPKEVSLSVPSFREPPLGRGSCMVGGMTEAPLQS